MFETKPKQAPEFLDRFRLDAGTNKIPIRVTSMLKYKQ
jgi:hypothetical protein